MKIRILLTLSLFLSGISSNCMAQTNDHKFFVGARGGINFLDETNSPLGVGGTMGLDAGAKIGNIGNASLSLLTCGFNPFTQVFFYVAGFSREVIWNFSASVYLGIRRYTKEDSVLPGYELPAAGTGFSYGLGVSYLFPNLFELGESSTVQLIPEVIYLKSPDLNWYGGTMNLRFNIF